MTRKGVNGIFVRSNAIQNGCITKTPEDPIGCIDMKPSFFTVGIIGWIILSFLALYMMTLQHEFTHQAIYKNFGYNSSVYITWWGGMTVLENNILVNQEDYRIIGSLQAVNELVSYQYNIMFFFVCGSYLLLFVTLEKYFKKMGVVDE